VQLQSDCTTHTCSVAVLLFHYPSPAAALDPMMCSQYAFSSVIQRAMAEGGVRLHYGHPDVFNRLHVMARVS
jgi:hypothetical protein